MTSTYTSYNLVIRDMSSLIEQIANQSRVFKFAMKARGVEAVGCADTADSLLSINNRKLGGR